MNSILSFAALFACRLVLSLVVAAGMQDAATRSPTGVSDATLGIPAHTATF